MDERDNEVKNRLYRQSDEDMEFDKKKKVDTLTGIHDEDDKLTSLIDKVKKLDLENNEK